MGSEDGAMLPVGTNRLATHIALCAFLIARFIMPLKVILCLLFLTGAMAANGADQQTSASEHDLSSGDRKFVQMAADMDAREVQFSERAKEKAQNEQVREFATLMVQDHGKTNRELLKLAERFHASGGPPYKRQEHSVKKAVAELSALEGAEFDRRYMQAMLKDHQESVQLFERQAKSGKDPELKALAAKTLPQLQAHLQKAQQIAASLK
jgi:putative membrane protein